MNKERKEAWMRIVVGIISGIILGAWKSFISILAIINFFYAIFAKRRMKELAEMGEIWNTQDYIFHRYMIFESNFRPFPFTRLKKKISRFGK